MEKCSNMDCKRKGEKECVGCFSAICKDCHIDGNGFCSYCVGLRDGMV